MSINFALLGAGRIGQVHAQAINATKGARLASVADHFPAAAEAVAQEYGAQVQSIDEIAADEGIAAVVICTPTNTHADLIEMFARAGKAVFCEKPIDLNVRRVKECLSVVADENARLMVGFNRRFDPHFAALKSEIDKGSIGDVEMINIISRDPGAPPAEYIKVSGGIFRDMTIHDFDMARFLLGEEVDTVMASASCLVNPAISELGDFDSASIILTTASGRQCSISNSRRATYGYDQRIEVHGSKGLVSAENQRPVSIEVAGAGGYTRPPLHNFFMTRYTQAYAAEITAFIKTIEGKDSPSPDGYDGLQSLILAEAALKSVAESRAVKVIEI